MHTITNCPRCGIDFMYHNSDYHLERDITIIDEVGNNEIITMSEMNARLKKEYPLKDDVWNSRYWNLDKTDYTDLSGEVFIVCHDCDYVENDIEALQRDFQFSNYESYKELEKFHGTQNLWSCGLMTVNQEKFDEEGRLSFQSYRLLTEEEFNKRSLPFIKQFKTIKMNRKQLLESAMTEEKNVNAVVASTLKKDSKFLTKAKRDLEDKLDDVEESIEERLSSNLPLDRSVVEALFAERESLKASIELYEKFEKEFISE